MDLSRGIELVSIPGPTVLPDRVRAALAEPMPDIYEGPLVDRSYEVLERLPAVARTDGKAFIVISNGHGAWQMALSNTLRPGDKVLVLESGRFAVVWGDYAKTMGVDVEVLPGSFREAVDPAAVAARLDADRGHEITAILTVHTDTSSSARNDIAAIRAAIDSVGHPALLMVDCIASLGCEPYEMDAWGVDVTVGASQKGLMSPPGLGFVWAGPRALEAYDRLVTDGVPRVGYVDWERRRAPRAFYEIFAGTPHVSGVRALGVALDLIDEEGGLEATWARHTALADAVRSAVEAWSTSGGLELNVLDPAARSNAVTTIRTNEIDADELRRITKQRAGVTLGIGIADVPGTSFRIGHMGFVNVPMVLGTLGAVETALHVMDAPVGSSGLAAAASSLADSLRFVG